MAQLNSDKVIYCHDIFIQQKGLLKNLKSTTILILRCCFKSAFALILPSSAQAPVQLNWAELAI